MSSDDYSVPTQQKPSDASDSSMSSMPVYSYQVPEEASRYYYGIGYRLYANGRIGLSGPKLVYRTSKDVWDSTEDDHGGTRKMRLDDVPRSHLLSQDPTLWDRIRSEAVEVFKREGIKFTSVELVCFTFELKKEYDYDDDDDDDDLMVAVRPVETDTSYTTPPTIWVGVLANSLSAERAHELSVEILDIVSKHNVTDVDVAFRESEAQLASGPALFAPVDDFDNRKEVIDNVSAALPLFVAGKKTTMQGTLTSYFRVGKDLYAIGARHNFFKEGEDDAEYNYNESAPKKEVILMGPSAFSEYLISVRHEIDSLTDTVRYLVDQQALLQNKVDIDLDDIEPARQLTKTCRDIAKSRATIDTIKAFYVGLAKDWGKEEDRVIGHVVWAPKIEVSVPPHDYTKDFCVIRLDKAKFKDGFSGNTLSLGMNLSSTLTSISTGGNTASKFLRLMYYYRDDVTSNFEYPIYGLAEIQGMLTARQISTSNSKDGEGPIRVITRGMTTKMNVGTMTKFRAHVRRYLSTGPRDSVEVMILPHPNFTDPISRCGDSGALIVDAFFHFVALLTGGGSMGNDDVFYIAYGTLFEWIWDLVKDKFPGADLYFGDLADFFSA